MTNTPITNESEAMEVWLRAVNTFAQAPVPHRPTVFDQAAARVIATALEARDAEIATWQVAAQTWQDNAQEAMARIAELEGALKHIATCNREPVTDRADHYRRVACRALTKGDTTHD